MNYKKIKYDGYNLHLIQIDKFKTITIKFNLKRKLVKEEITKRNMLVNVLCESTNKFKTRRELEIETEELYNLGYRAATYISGCYSIMGFDISFLEEKYTEKNMIKRSIEFLKDIIFNPNIENGAFDELSFLNSYHNLKDNLDSIKENPRMYSKIRMLELMSDSAISYRSIGYIEDLDQITRKNLYDYYQDIIKNDIVDIFVIGNIDFDQITKELENFEPYHNEREKPTSHFIKEDSNRTIPQICKEQQNTEQSNLVIGYSLNDLTDFELRYVLTVYSYILGGSPDSKLFQTVREKNSLCYSISSVAQPLISVLMVIAGINANDFEKVIELVEQEVNSIEQGKFSDDEIEKAKITYKNSINELVDDPESLLSMYAGMEYLGSDDIENRLINIDRVNRTDILNLSKKIKINTIYLLEGVKNEKK